AAFAVAALSMIGLPPTAGFFSKWYLALACLKAESWPLVAVIALSSLLNAVYFFRVLERMYLRKASAEEGIPGPPASNPGEAPPSMLIPILILGLGVLLIGLANAWIVEKVIKLAIPSGL
ncbi:MAG: NADH/ubiquinone/plastoquinone (complex I), partial [Planctomycetes bacterium]|nr:NADH/ubiquinone/plastoquinone (complex I) [Planctomycetota bacterium]